MIAIYNGVDIVCHRACLLSRQFGSLVSEGSSTRGPMLNLFLPYLWIALLSLLDPMARCGAATAYVPAKGRQGIVPSAHDDQRSPFHSLTDVKDEYYWNTIEDLQRTGMAMILFRAQKAVSIVPHRDLRRGAVDGVAGIGRGEGGSTGDVRLLALNFQLILRLPHAWARWRIRIPPATAMSRQRTPPAASAKNGIRRGSSSCARRCIMHRVAMTAR